MEKAFPWEVIPGGRTKRRNREMMKESLPTGVPEGSLKAWGALRTIG